MCISRSHVSQVRGKIPYCRKKTYHFTFFHLNLVKTTLFLPQEYITFFDDCLDFIVEESDVLKKKSLYKFKDKLHIDFPICNVNIQKFNIN